MPTDALPPVLSVRDSQQSPRPTVLVVEDDEDIMQCLKIRLEVNGFDVLAAGDQATALKLAKQCAPDAAIFDVSFPGGDGVLLTESLRREPATADLPVMILTASMRPGIQEEAMASGATGFMRKPYDSGALVKKLRSWCGENCAEV
jgi:CheY-like chemotaxis protein